jgi:hypothetical protein
MLEKSLPGKIRTRGNRTPHTVALRSFLQYYPGKLISICRSNYVYAHYSNNYATSEIAKEVIFAKILLEEIEFQIQFSININCYNVGDIYLANNHCNNLRTKHIDTCRHFVCEWGEDNILTIIFTPTLENTADIINKNPTEAIFQKHAEKDYT